jgi:hypothetical protein
MGRPSGTDSKLRRSHGPAWTDVRAPAEARKLIILAVAVAGAAIAVILLVNGFTELVLGRLHP